jgi:hypothetical protein
MGDSKRSGFETTQKPPDLAVPWEQELPPEKWRFDVRRICGGPGQSGMGIVYLAYDREYNAPFALKTFQGGFGGKNLISLLS